MPNHTLTTLTGFQVGHAHNLAGPTGCTVILCPPGTVGGVDQRGGAPGTRETDLLRPMHLVEHVHAILLAGGSAYGLAAATGVMRWLEEHAIGINVSVGVVPIVPAAIIFDLDVGDPRIRPDEAMGYAACRAASSAPVTSGCVGAGAGARVGTMAGIGFACKSGIGSALIELDGGIKVAALLAVNAVGDVVDEQGHILAGARTPPDGQTFADSLALLRQNVTTPPPAPPTNTIVGMVATNATLTKTAVNKVAQMAHNGLAQAVRPTHTMFDGDTIFALASGEKSHANVSAIGTFAAEAVAAAVRQAVSAATPLAGLPTGPGLSPQQL